MVENLSARISRAPPPVHALSQHIRAHSTNGTAEVCKILNSMEKPHLRKTHSIRLSPSPRKNQNQLFSRLPAPRPTRVRPTLTLGIPAGRCWYWGSLKSGLEKRVTASWMHFTWLATTDSTSMEMRLNSSKQPHAPTCVRPVTHTGRAERSRLHSTPSVNIPETKSTRQEPTSISHGAASSRRLPPLPSRRVTFCSPYKW